MALHLMRAIACVSFVVGSVRAVNKEAACGTMLENRISKVDLSNLDAQTTRTKIAMQSIKCTQVSVHHVRTPECEDREWCVDECTGCRTGKDFYEVIGYYTGQHNPASYQ